MRRLRTTWTARKSKYWHGAVTVDPNHSAKVEGDNYLTRSADLDEVDTTIEGAQQDLMRRAQAVALVVADEDTLADAVDDPTFATQRGEGSNSSGWDMFAAACRDPFSSPFGPKGTFCTAAVWSCLVCPLAVITPSKLPALMRLEGYLRDQSAAVTQTEWLRIYGPAWVQLTTRIFPKFAESVIAEARRIVEENLDLPMPIEPLES
ncbi:hypothetical protein ASF30_05185 [Leifsonia sp. Leaf264]|nr:hypothetical protein ASF30_05185 [Leifsonia sp. Leaf264]